MHFIYCTLNWAFVRRSFFEAVQQFLRGLLIAVHSWNLVPSVYNGFLHCRYLTSMSRPVFY